MANKLARSRSLFPFGPFWDDVFTAVQPRTADRQLRPALDVMEDEDAIVVSIELPGIDKDAVNVSIEDGVLSISGEKKTETEKDEANYHVIERSYGSFARSLTLPSHVAFDSADAKFENGVLIITLPKQEQAKPKRLEIN